MTELERAFVDACRERLTTLGWLFASEAQDDSVRFAMHGSAELSYDLEFGLERIDTIGLLPSMGIRHQTVSELSAMFSGLPSGRASAFGRGLADLLVAAGVDQPWFRWRAVSLGDVEPVARQLCDDIRIFGMEFVQPYATLADVIHGLEHERRHQWQTGDLAIAYALAGDLTRARLALSEFVSPPGQPIIPVGSPQFTEFLRGFVDHFCVDEATLPADVRGHLQRP